MTRLLYLSADPGVPVLGHKGASVHVRELAAALAEAGAEVHVASPRTAPEGEAAPAGVELHAIPAVVAKKLTTAALHEAVSAQAEAVAELAAALGADAVYERYSLFSPAGVRAAAALGVPHALEVNAPLREEARRFRTLPHPDLARAFEVEVMTSTGRVLAVSEPVASALARDGVAEGKLEVLPNGVAAHRFPAPRRDPARFVVGFAGSLKPWHGVETMVEALARVPEVHLEVIGDGPAAPALDRLPREGVTRRGAVPHATAIEAMAGWDVGLAPYAPLEGYWFSPLKVLEYMAAGACPIASDLGEARDTLAGGRRGVLIPAGDPGALARAIRALAHDRPRAGALGRKARAWVAENRSWSHNAARVLASLRADAGVPAG